MNESLIKWIHAVKDIELPGISQNIDKVKSLTHREDIDMEQLSNMTELDIGLSLRLVRRINRIQSHGGRSRINSISQAIMMFGMEQIRELPNKLPTLESIKDRPEVTYHYLRLLKQSYHAAYQARQWGRMLRDEDPNELFLATYLRNMGQMLLWIHAPDKMQQIEEMIRDRGVDPVEAQHVTLGFAINEFSKELAKLWNLPSLFRESLYPENASHRRVLLVVLAVQLSRACDKDWYSRDTRLIEDDIAEALRKERNATVAMIHINAVQAARISSFIKIPHPAARLLYPAYEIDPNLTRSTEIAPENSSNLRHQDVHFCLAPQLPMVAKMVKKLSSPNKLPMKIIIQTAMQAMHDGLGLNRVVFGLISNNRKSIKARSIMGSDNDPNFNQFRIELLPGTLFERMMTGSNTLWVDQHNRAKYGHLVPESFLHKVGANGFFVSTLHVNGKAVGLFYADRHTDHCHLDERSYRLFKRISSQVIKKLEELMEQPSA
jgi:HD-like signal output (HDOD) protein